MNKFRIIINESSLGITQKSLQIFRNELARRIDHVIEIIQLNTNDLCCGFLILDYDTKEAVFSGDGFRTDDGGERGAGMRSAETLLDLYGKSTLDFFDVLPPIVIKETSYQSYFWAINKYLNDLSSHLPLSKATTDKKKLSQFNPMYVR